MDEPSGSVNVVIGVSGCDSAPLVWRLEDLRAARRCGVVGSLVGALARTPRQNSKMGRPMLLLPEEEKLLRAQCAAGTMPPGQQVAAAELNQQVALYEAEQRLSHQEQQVLALQDRKSCLIRAMTTGCDPDDGVTDEELQGRLKVLDQNFAFPQTAIAVQLSTARAGLSNCPESRALLQASDPTRVESDIRFQVFKDLRGRGFFLTSAGKFGGDFLVYPGDPLRFHAHFIAICQPLEQSVCLLDVLAVARLGSNVKKTVLLCSPGVDGVVVYTSLQWSGMV